MRKPITIVREYKELLDRIPEMIEESGLKKKFVFEKLGMSKANYYQRVNKPEIWKFEELEKLFELLEGRLPASIV